MNPDDLRHITVLRMMDDASRARLANVLEAQEFAEGQTIFAEGDPGDAVYFLASGHIRVQKRADTAGTAQKTLAVLEPGDYFGEMALFEQKPRSAAAVASGTVRLLRLSRAAFEELRASNNPAGMGVLSAMIRTSSERIRRLSAEVVVYDEIGKAIGEARGLDALLDVILQQLSLATLADWGLLVLRAQFSTRLEVRSQVNLALSPAQRDGVADGQGFLAPLLRDPQDQRVACFDEQEPFKSSPRLGFETPSLLIATIAVEDQLLGLILLGDQEPDHFDLNALNLARGVARQAGQAILNARHREEEQARSRHSRQFVRF